MGFLSLESIRVKARDLPAISTTASILLKQIDNPNLTKEDLCQLIAMDQVLCAQAYSYANSKAMGAKKELLSIPEIVDYLGIKTLKHIVVLRAAKNFIHDPVMWFESVFISNTAKILSRLYGEKQKNQDLVYATALFHSYGQIILATHHNKEYLALKGIKDFYERLAKEKEHFHFNHIEISTIVLPQLEFPKSIIELIRSQSHIDLKDFSKLNLYIELARALMDMEILDDKLLQKRLAEHRIAALCKKYELDLSLINSKFVRALFKETDRLIAIQ